MKKSLLIAVLVMFAAFVFAGCNAEALKKLTEENATLQIEAIAAKAKIADLEKAKADLQNQLNAAHSKVAAAAAAAAAAPAPAADDKGKAPAGKKDAPAAKKGGAAPKKGKK